MLAVNPICKELYEYGFNGRQNVFEFWTENRDDILNYLAQKRPDILGDPYFLRDFEAKIRWRSHVGIQLTLEAYRILRRRKNKEVVDFSDVRIKQGPRYYSYNDLGAMYPLEEPLAEGKTDMRGISIVRFEIENVTLSNLDLKYASFDSTTFENVTFSNSILDYVRFCRGEVKRCIFDKYSSLDYMDLSDTLFNAEINRAFEPPLLTSLMKRHVAGVFSGLNKRWRSYSEVDSVTFYEYCKSKSVKERMYNQQTLIEKAYELKGINLYKQSLFLLSLPDIKQPKTLRASMNREKYNRKATPFEISQIW